MESKIVLDLDTAMAPILKPWSNLPSLIRRRRLSGVARGMPE